MSEITNLRDDFIKAIDFADNDLIKFLSEIGIVETFRKQLGKGLDRDERIPNFVGHARGQIGPESRSIDEVLLLAQLLFDGQILHDRDGAEWRIVIQQAS